MLDIEERPGVVSMMRKGVKRCIFWGGVLIASGVVLSFAMMIAARYDLIPVSVAMITGGPGLMALALGAKAWQAKSEPKE